MAQLEFKADSEHSISEHSSWQPKIIALVCNWCTYAGADMAGTARLEYPPNVRAVRLPCTGRIDPLFIVKAFEQGADAVLVSGCHPGDCHYVQGNYLARRRFTIFRALMQFMGLEMQRLQFAWVSASEGAKWADLIEEITNELKAIGPMPTKWAEPSSNGAGRTIELPKRTTQPPEPLSANDYEQMTADLRRIARELLERDEVGVIIGYGQARLPDSIVPTFVTKPEDVERLVLNERCVNNLSVYLTNALLTKYGRMGIIAKGCDAKAIIGLIQENKVKREDVVIIGVECRAVIVNDAVAMKCYACDVRTPKFYDHLINAPSGVSDVEPRDDPRDAQIAFLDSLSPIERWDYWQHQFARCIRCYACRAVCPLCYCEPCIADKHRPQWIPTTVDGKGNFSWNLFRAMHLAGRCIGCDECARACPANIRLDLINRKLVLEIEQQYGYRAGYDLEASPPLTTFRPEDKAEFIH
ncbi:MAG TPA: hydrogenase iron-sulfur subunit [Armatimonadetes bacterium]|nr:hydrogenase iron-sulfur subunit [Armatimonadota bacterium]